MTSLPEKPPVRSGKCSLILSIDGRTYAVRPAAPIARGSRTWHLTVTPHQPRAGLTYSVLTHHGRVDCTCPDATRNFAACKHQQALRALGLIPASARPAGQLTWETLHPKPARKPRRTAAPLPAAAASGPDPLAKARRRHQPADQITDAAPAFAAGFRTAVAEHVATLATGGLR